MQPSRAEESCPVDLRKTTTSGRNQAADLTTTSVSSEPMTTETASLHKNPESRIASISQERLEERAEA
jgi:hypothetical protein